MQTSHRLTHWLLTLFALVMAASVSLAADPGISYPLTSEASDQKAGSVLFYNLYASKSTNTKSEDTDISITNTNRSESVVVHIFFVDGSTCSLSADIGVCLTPWQTTSFLVSDVDPDETGYIVAVAVKSSGYPVSFNYLIGSEYVKLASDHAASLNAEAFAALYTDALPESGAGFGMATLNFDGIVYNRAPRVLAFDNIRSVVDGNSALLIVNRVGGALPSGTTLGLLFGVLHNDVDFGYTFLALPSGCQLRSELSDSFPRVIGLFSNAIPSGHTGWMEFWATADVGILGAVINFNNKKANKGQAAFSGGRNLHKLTLTTDSLTIPLFETRPAC